MREVLLGALLMLCVVLVILLVAYVTEDSING